VTSSIARRNEDLVDEIVNAIGVMLPDVSPEVAAEAVAVSARNGPALRALLDSLNAREDALGSGGAISPAFVKLALALHDRGAAGVVVPGCARCGRVTRDPRRVDGVVGVVCQSCYQDSRRRECTSCRRVGRVAVVTDAGPICGRCYQRDTARHEVCVGCGNSRRVAHRDQDRQPRCGRCYPRPKRTCARCGALAFTEAVTDAGPVCSRCHPKPQRQCGRCGRVRAISRRATGDNPDLCYSCDRGPVDTCGFCGREASRVGRRDGLPYCNRCYLRPQHRCAFCGDMGTITVKWASGAVCTSCYPRLRREHHACPHCGKQGTLTEIDADGGPVCATCAGSGPIYTCGRCQGPSDGHIRGRCASCALAERIDVLLSGPTGEVPESLQGIRKALCEWPNPRSVLTWLNRSQSIMLLAALTQRNGDLSHADLDAFPPSKFAHHLRRALVHARALPERDEALERVKLWLDDLLAGKPAEQVQLVRPFAQWVVLRRARQRSQRRPTTEAGASWARQRVRSALDLLAWLAARGTAFQSLDQATLDEWLVGGRSSRYDVRDFITWATKQRLVDNDIEVPRRQIQSPAAPLNDDDRWHHLHRCIHDADLPIRVRVAGALLLLYGHLVSRIVAIREEQIEQRADGTYLSIDGHAALMPPLLAELIQQLRDLPPTPSVLAGGTRNGWLFPGLVPTQHLGINYLVKQLNSHGIRARPGRTGALIALAADLPAPVLADLLGLHINTAVRWVRRSRRDWASYVAARDEQQD
jgi:hypothetical protein